MYVYKLFHVRYEDLNSFVECVSCYIHLTMPNKPDGRYIYMQIEHKHSHKTSSEEWDCPGGVPLIRHLYLCFMTLCEYH